MLLRFQPNNPTTEHKERKKKESIVDLSRYLEKIIRVKFAGGREVSGILKGYDPLVNLVLDNTTEYLRGKFICIIPPEVWRINVDAHIFLVFQIRMIRLSWPVTPDI